MLTIIRMIPVVPATQFWRGVTRTIEYGNLRHSSRWGKDSVHQFAALNQTNACDCPGPHLLCKQTVIRSLRMPSAYRW